MSDLPTPPRGEPPHDPALDAWIREARENASPVDLEDVFAAVHAETRAEATSPRARLRAAPTPFRFALALGIATAIVLLVALVAPRTDLQTLPLLRHLAVLGSVGLVLALALRGALRPLHLPDIGWGRPVAWASVSVAAAGALALLAPPGVHDAAAHEVCFLGGLGMGLPVFLAARLLDRGTLAGPLLAAVSGGLAGYLALHVHCGVDERAHLLLGHATVVLAFALLAGLVQWLRRRPTGGGLTPGPTAGPDGAPRSTPPRSGGR